MTPSTRNTTPTSGTGRNSATATAADTGLGRRGGLILALLMVLALVAIPQILPGTRGAFTASVTNVTNTAKVMRFLSCKAALTKETSRYFASAFKQSPPVNLKDGTQLAARNLTVSTGQSGCLHDDPGFIRFGGSTSTPSTVSYALGENAETVQTYTQELWMRTTTPQGSLMALTNVPNYRNEIQRDRQLYLGSNGKLIMGNYIPATKGFEIIESPVTVTDGAWHHIVAVHDAVAQHSWLYVDGKLVGDIAAPGILEGYLSAHWRVGCAQLTNWPNAPAQSSECFKGDMAFVAAYKKALTAQDVMDHYRAGTW